MRKGERESQVLKIACRVGGSGSSCTFALWTLLFLLFYVSFFFSWPFDAARCSLAAAAAFFCCWYVLVNYWIPTYDVCAYVTDVLAGCIHAAHRHRPTCVLSLSLSLSCPAILRASLLPHGRKRQTSTKLENEGVGVHNCACVSVDGVHACVVSLPPPLLSVCLLAYSSCSTTSLPRPTDR